MAAVSNHNACKTTKCAVIFQQETEECIGGGECVNVVKLHNSVKSYAPGTIWQEWLFK